MLRQARAYPDAASINAEKTITALATRYEKTACNFLAGVYLAAAIIWLD